MERLGKPLVRIKPSDYPSLRECVVASFKINGPMTDEELHDTLPNFTCNWVKRIAASLPDEVTGR